MNKLKIQLGDNQQKIIRESFSIDQHFLQKQSENSPASQDIIYSARFNFPSSESQNNTQRSINNSAHQVGKQVDTVVKYQHSDSKKSNEDQDKKEEDCVNISSTKKSPAIYQENNQAKQKLLFSQQDDTQKQHQRHNSLNNKENLQPNLIEQIMTKQQKQQQSKNFQQQILLQQSQQSCQQSQQNYEYQLKDTKEYSPFQEKNENMLNRQKINQQKREQNHRMAISNSCNNRTYNNNSGNNNNINNSIINKQHLQLQKDFFSGNEDEIDYYQKGNTFIYSSSHASENNYISEYSESKNEPPPQHSLASNDSGRCEANNNNNNNNKLYQLDEQYYNSLCEFSNNSNNAGLNLKYDHEPFNDLLQVLEHERKKNQMFEEKIKKLEKIITQMKNFQNQLYKTIEDTKEDKYRALQQNEEKVELLNMQLDKQSAALAELADNKQVMLEEFEETKNQLKESQKQNVELINENNFLLENKKCLMDEIEALRRALEDNKALIRQMNIKEDAQKVDRLKIMNSCNQGLQQQNNSNSSTSSNNQNNNNLLISNNNNNNQSSIACTQTFQNEDSSLSTFWSSNVSQIEDSKDAHITSNNNLSNMSICSKAMRRKTNSYDNGGGTRNSKGNYSSLTTKDCSYFCEDNDISQQKDTDKSVQITNIYSRQKQLPPPSQNNPRSSSSQHYNTNGNSLRYQSQYCSAAETIDSLRLQKQQQQIQEQVNQRRHSSSFTLGVQDDEENLYLYKRMVKKLIQRLELQSSSQVNDKVKELQTYYKQTNQFVQCILEIVSHCAPQGFFKDSLPSLKEAWKFIKKIMEKYMNLKKSFIKLEADRELLDQILHYLQVNKDEEALPKLIQVLIEQDLMLKIVKKTKFILHLEWTKSLAELDKALEVEHYYNKSGNNSNGQQGQQFGWEGNFINSNI